MRHHLVLALALTATVAAGCTSAKGHLATSPTSRGSSSPSATSVAPISLTPTVTIPTPSSTISATSTAQPWSIVVAKQHAMQIVTSAASALATLSKVSPNATLAQAQAALRALADADETAVHQLAAGAWPVTVRVKVNALIAALDTESRTLKGTAARTSIAAMQQDSTSVRGELTEVQSAGQALITAL